MRRSLAFLMSLVLILSVCACGKEPEPVKERACGVYVELEANDIYTVSCGTDEDCLMSAAPADGSYLELGKTVHFDLAGEAAEGTAPCVIEYTICLYDKDMNILTSKSFSDDFSNMARVNITVTRDHEIFNENDASSFGGELIVEVSATNPSNNVYVAVPTVTVSSSESASASINENIAKCNESFLGKQLDSAKEAYNLNISELPKGQTADSFSMSRYVRVARGDSSVLSVRMQDKTNLGIYTETAITGHNYDVVTGAEIKIINIATDFNKLKSICSESILSETTSEKEFEDIIFNASYTDALVGLISDGHWYFSSDGIVFAVGSGVIADRSFGAFEFTVSYDKIGSVLKSEYLPPETEGSSGDIDYILYKDRAKNTEFIGSEPDDGVNSPMGIVSGNIYNVRVYKATLKDDGRYSLDSLLWYCSDMSDGACFAINRELKSSADIYISFMRPDGTGTKRLLSLGKDGSIIASDPDGIEKGHIISSELPYQEDLNSDGIDEKIDTETKDDGTKALVVSSSGKSYSLDTKIKSSMKIRLFDIDGNNVREIYIDGKNADGEYVCYAALFNNQSLNLLAFDGKTSLDGKISGFSEKKLIVKSASETAYVFSGNAFTSEGV